MIFSGLAKPMRRLWIVLPAGRCWWLPFKDFISPPHVARLLFVKHATARVIALVVNCDIEPQALEFVDHDIEALGNAGLRNDPAIHDRLVGVVAADNVVRLDG